MGLALRIEPKKSSPAEPLPAASAIAKWMGVGQGWGSSRTA